MRNQCLKTRRDSITLDFSQEVPILIFKLKSRENKKKLEVLYCWSSYKEKLLRVIFKKICYYSQMKFVILIQVVVISAFYRSPVATKNKKLNKYYNLYFDGVLEIKWIFSSVIKPESYVGVPILNRLFNPRTTGLLPFGNMTHNFQLIRNKSWFSM